MNRSKPLQRRKPLKASTSLRRTQHIAGKPTVGQRRIQAARRHVYALVDARAAGRCEMCGRVTAQMEHSHRSHAGIGGAPSTLRASNLLLSCGPFGCNWKLSADADFAARGRDAGWLIGRGDDPERVPVLLWCGWVLLDDDGTHKEAL